ncbi:uncharacterized protein LOC106133457 [Amyelois transitella]|uniref:uncharacterized protein LOC106133457 n=1 Tax=Amyelois transitella TaxID=680683 RepID=UPI00067AE4D5|nr:uncharacterized protein LOC106133457 [Amyelois transitella]
MVATLIYFFSALAACNAVPIWITGADFFPTTLMRIGRSPSVAFGFGSGFSSNIGGIAHSTGIGSSFSTGDAQAYGSGMGGSDNAYARGVGIANARPSYPRYPLPYNNDFGRTSFGSAVSSAQNIGDYSSAVSSAQSHNGRQYGAAASAVQNAGPARYQSAVSSAQNTGLDYQSAVAAANSNDGHYGSAMSAANTGNYGDTFAHSRNNFAGYGAAVSAAENIGGYRASTAQAVQQQGGALQQSGASSINAPGIQAAQSHAMNTGYY